MLQALPNEAHQILAELEKHIKVSIITQNIDNLHERAGSTNVLHLHGEIFKVCNEDKTQVIEIGNKEIHLGDKADDGSQLRPFVVWFGEQVPLLDNAIKNSPYSRYVFSGWHFIKGTTRSKFTQYGSK